MKLAYVFLFVCLIASCSVCASTAREIESEMATTATVPPADLPAIDFAPLWAYAPYVLAAAALIFVIVKIAKSPQGQSIFVALALLALVFVVGYEYLYGDKTGDGESDSMVIVPAQLTGDVETDSAYVDINDGSAVTNVKNMGAGLMLIVGLLVSMLAVSFVAILIKSRG